MMPYILVLFILMPIVEIAVLIQVGSAIGVWTTLAIVILTAIIGTAMLRQQGLSTMNQARQRMEAGELPAQQLLEALLLLVGGVLLLTPGFVTDAFGFACLIPFTRRLLAAQLAARSKGKMNVVFGGMSGGSPFSTSSGEKPFSGRGSGASGAPPGRRSTRVESEADIIEGDFRRED